ncbi:precorrin-6Y C5,15-methyltransferase (decarboxylating) subunit CbiT [Treponema sp.]|uniref:precorrin-6Y C5,15-methyltransferase (decarboxylating) subunit CbiT n=1 Tax=Treponema sp. TaxID=166 RepID=UPI00298E320A|nr:precorrin-6Y C5,15-methyltransferase (decarboxylating) subunit CbiT [Treponema sp.]MCQ2240064.1 precorrin-6Y C5,15-methyltransferase (decarboxylating) subunit CbiT [Treponema sp.]
MEKIITHGIKDSEFIRGEVPMTKEEVRIISISKLELTENSILYDIGSGTGSIAIESAQLSPSINVFAIEANPIAVDLIRQNKEKFKADNIEIIEGFAPSVLESLPIPTHAFIGGTKGNLKSILETLYKKNPKMRIVMNAISLESISEMADASKTFRIVNDEVIQVAISKANKIGNYHMMQANNPVFIFSFNFAG